MNQDSNLSPLYFECGMCGDCCSSWQIPLEGWKAARLMERPWVRERLAETRRELKPLSPDLYRIPLTDENFCVFLAPDRRCMVEAHEGLALKPDECRRFPFATVGLPGGGTGYEASAACKKISEKLLSAFQPILPKPHSNESADGDSQRTREGDRDLDAFLQLVEDPLVTLPEKIPVGWSGSLPIAAYERWRQSLRAIFSRPDITPEQALREARHFLDSIRRKKPERPTVCRAQTDPGFPPMLAHLIALLFLRKPYRTLSGLQLLWNGFYHDPRVFGGPVDLREQRRIRWNAEHDPLLNAFLYSILLRRRPLASGMSLSSLLAMASVACLLVRWHAATLAWLQGQTIPGRSDVSGAIRLVERYYTGHQPRFMRFFVPRIRGKLLEILLLSLSFSCGKRGFPVRAGAGIG